MEEKDKQKNKPVDKANGIYDKIEHNREKYLDLMAEDELANAIKFNHKLNERLEKLGIKTCDYVPEEGDDGEN